MGRPWTEEDDWVVSTSIMGGHDGTSISELAEVLGRTEAAIKTRRQMLKAIAKGKYDRWDQRTGYYKNTELAPRRNQKWTREEVDYLVKHMDTDHVRDIAEHLGRSIRATSNRRREVRKAIVKIIRDSKETPSPKKVNYLLDRIVVTKNSEFRQMPIRDFMDLGFLQEINRKLLHQAGLALAIEVPASDDATGGAFYIIDCRDDPEGMVFGHGAISQEKIDIVDGMRDSKWQARQDLIGSFIQRPD